MCSSKLKTDVQEGTVRPEDTIAGPSTDPVLNQRLKAPRKGNPLPWQLVSALLAVVLITVLWAGRFYQQPTAGVTAGISKSVSIGFRLAPANLDIRNQSGAALDQALIGNVYEGLVSRDQTNRVMPSLANSWKISEDATTYTFHLNPNLTFSNGDKLDAEDVAWSINQLMEHHYHDADQLQNFQSVKAIDKDHVQLQLTAPYANILWVLTGRAGLVFDRKAQYDPKTQVVGSGPYTVESFTPNSSLVLKANTRYWGRQHRAKTETLHLRYFADDNAAVNALKSQDIQVLAPITANLATPFTKDTEHYSVHSGAGSDKYVLAFNNKGSKTSDMRVRQAIRYAINHQDLIDSRGGVDQPMGGPIPSVDPGYRDITNLYPYNPERAKQLMAQVGYTPNKPLTLRLTYPNTYGTELGDQLRSQLKPIGINLQLQVVEFSTWMQDVYTNHNYDLSLVDHSESHDFSQWTNPNYYYGYDSKVVRDLYAQAMAARKAEDTDHYLAQAAQQVSQDAPADWLFNYRITTVTLTGLRGFPLNLNQTLLNAWKISYSPDKPKTSGPAARALYDRPKWRSSDHATFLQYTIAG